MTKGEGLSTSLPEELVEKILAMVPFPQLFKARALSKSWQARLSSISSHNDEEEKLLAVSFQKQVCESSEKWNASYPGDHFRDFLIVSDCASQQRRKIQTLSGLPLREDMSVMISRINHTCWSDSSMGGALLCMTPAFSDILFVVNIFTGSWRELPAMPHMDTRYGTRGRLVGTKESYKVIRLYGTNGCACALIYDSKLGAWRTKKVDVREIRQDFMVDTYNVNLNGVLYVLVYFQKMAWGFLAFDVEEETFNLLQMPSTDMFRRANWESTNILVCNGAVYVHVRKDSLSTLLLKADLASRTWAEVICSPLAALNFDSLLRSPSSDGVCLFFEGNGGDGDRFQKILAYNVLKDEWSFFTIDRSAKKYLRTKFPCDLDSSFQPGLNPFLEV